LCKKPVPDLSAKNSNIAGGGCNCLVAPTSVSVFRKKAPRLPEEEILGNLLLEKKVLRARRSCINGHPSVSRSLSLKKHVGFTPSGPGASAKNSNIFKLNWEYADPPYAGDKPRNHSRIAITA
jgi:hypothetical protein